MYPQKHLSCLLGLVVLIFFSVTAGYSQNGGLVSDPSLKLHLDFDLDVSPDRVLDVSGHESHAWQFNATNPVAGTAGVFGSAGGGFTYVGVLTNDPPNVLKYSQYLAVTNVAAFEYLTNGTISFWAQIGTNGDLAMHVLDNGYRPSFTPDPTLSSNSWTIARIYQTYLSFVVHYSSGGVRVVRWPTDVVRAGGSNPDLSTTKMNLYTVTIDCPNDRVVAYYNGVPYQTNSIGLPWIRVYGSHSRRWLCVGAMAHAGTPQWADDKYPNAGFFVGRMDEVRIYNRTLSAAEVLALYHGVGTPAASSFVGLQPTGPTTVQLDWAGRTNVFYQVEYRTNLNSGSWTSLLAPLEGSGGTNSITDSMSGHATKFYRVRPLP